jgi:hypothetical protein
MEDNTQNLNAQSGEAIVSKDTDDISPIEEAKKIQEENKKILEQMTAERKKMEKAAADLMVGGRSFAGQQTKKELTEEEKWEISAKERYKGTGLDPTPSRK